jgi:hypothetical protein
MLDAIESRRYQQASPLTWMPHIKDLQIYCCRHDIHLEILIPKLDWSLPLIRAQF